MNLHQIIEEEVQRVLFLEKKKKKRRKKKTTKRKSGGVMPLPIMGGFGMYPLFSDGGGVGDFGDAGGCCGE